MTACKENLDSIPADASLYLMLKLSGYGSIKTKWKNILICTGAVEAVVQGIAVGVASQYEWLGLGVAAEEMTSEYLTWNGVDWLLGETYAPVTLEGQMIYMQTRKIIWRASYFVTENSAELDKLGKEERKDKSILLKASLHKAGRKLMSKLNSYVTKEVLRELDRSFSPSTPSTRPGRFELTGRPEPGACLEKGCAFGIDLSEIR